MEALLCCHRPYVATIYRCVATTELLVVLLTSRHAFPEMFQQTDMPPLPLPQVDKDLSFEKKEVAVLASTLIFAKASPPPPLFPKFVAIPVNTSDELAGDSASANSTAESSFNAEEPPPPIIPL